MDEDPGVPLLFQYSPVPAMLFQVKRKLSRSSTCAAYLAMSVVVDRSPPDAFQHDSQSYRRRSFFTTDDLSLSQPSPPAVDSLLPAVPRCLLLVALSRFST